MPSLVKSSRKMDVFELKSGQRDFRSMLILSRTGIPCCAGVVTIYFCQRLLGGSQFVTCAVADIVLTCLLMSLHHHFRLCVYHFLSIILLSCSILYLSALGCDIMQRSTIIESIMAFSGLFVTLWCIALMTIIPIVRHLKRKNNNKNIWLK